MVCKQDVLFPEESVAVQMRVMVCPAGQVPLVASVNAKLGLGSQLSVATAWPVFDVSVDSPQPRMMSAGQVMLGLKPPEPAW